MAVSAGRKARGEILLAQGFVTKEQLEQGLKEQKRRGGALGKILVALGFIQDKQLLRALGAQAGMPIVHLKSVEIPGEVINMVSASIAQVYKIVPTEFNNGSLTVAMADPLNVNALDDLRFMLNIEVRGAVSNEDDVDEALRKYYGTSTESVQSLISEFEDSTLIEGDLEDGDLSEQSLEEIANAVPVVKFLNLILLQAIKDQASDIHFEPFESEFRIRYRIDGVLYEMTPPPKQLALALTSRVKVMAEMDIAERRLPQDSRIKLSLSGRPVELRVATLPTMFGESTVMRILDRTVMDLDLERVGMTETELEMFRTLLKLPHGIILVTGPTGSGKTTTLYSGLNEANNVGIKIITCEDPVEYDIDGIIQVEINPDVGLSFASSLRSILRQDPDMILVGEIRDLETASIAIEASLTGHVVFSTLHTNDSPSTITRMVDMGVEPYLLTATVESIISQRLVRRICTDCKEEYEPSEQELMELNLTQDQVMSRTFYYGKGCPKCNSTGYKGRTAIYEIMMMGDEVRDYILQDASTQTIREVARANGMNSLRDAGLIKIYDGITTIEEVVKATQLND